LPDGSINAIVQKMSVRFYHDSRDIRLTQIGHDWFHAYGDHCFIEDLENSYSRFSWSQEHGYWVHTDFADHDLYVHGREWVQQKKQDAIARHVDKMKQHVVDQGIDANLDHPDVREFMRVQAELLVEVDDHIRKINDAFGSKK
jgi:hypothetical protein